MELWWESHINPFSSEQFLGSKGTSLSKNLQNTEKLFKMKPIPGILDARPIEVC